VKRYVLSAEAKQDLDEIRRYLTEQAGARVARQVLAQIRDATVRLSRNPGMGHSREDLTDGSVKFWPIYSYLIVYRPSPRPIGIVRVLHGNRNVAKLLKESVD
jgi:toxin ParE1/3/4